MDESPTQADWRRWLEDHTPKFLLFARQQSRSDADAQDLVQEAVVEAWQRRNHRRAGREQAVQEPPAGPWFDNSVADRELKQLVQGAMKQLPERYREVITLKVWGGLTFAEIADALGIPANTAASHYRCGLAELRKLTKEVLA